MEVQAPDQSDDMPHYEETKFCGACGSNIGRGEGHDDDCPAVGFDDGYGRHWVYCIDCRGSGDDGTCITCGGEGMYIKW
jgi:hypothetical protein